MKKYPLIDVAKIYCAFLVVLMHTLEYPPGHYWAHLLQASLSFQAVPFFFIASGFFFRKKWDASENKDKFALDYVKRLLVYYALWVLITMPENLYTYLTKYAGQSFIYVMALMVRRIVFAGYGVYWYLLVTAEAAIVIHILLKRNYEKLMYALAVVGLLLGLAYYAKIDWLGLDVFHQVIYTIFSWSNNILMMGLPFMAVGCYLAHHCERWTMNSMKLGFFYIAVFLVHAIIFAAAYSAGSNPGRYTILYPLQALLLFLIAISADGVQIPDNMVRECRPLSSAIYCVHCFFIYYVIDPIISVTANTFLRFSLAVLLSVCFYWIIKKSNCKPLIRLITLK